MLLRFACEARFVGRRATLIRAAQWYRLSCGLTRSQSPEVHIYIHIPKNAGTTMIDVLRLAYRGQSQYQIQGHIWRQSVADLAALSPQARDHIDLVYGHCEHGLHVLFSRPCRYLTLLRDPVARLVSLYKFAIRDPNVRRMLNGVTDPRAIFESDRLVRSVDNGQTRFLAGPPCSGPQSCDGALFEKAVANIDSGLVLGTVERFDQALSAFADRLQWPAVPESPMRNVSPAGHETQLRTLILDEYPHLIEYDRRLYAMACTQYTAPFP